RLRPPPFLPERLPERVRAGAPAIPVAAGRRGPRWRFRHSPCENALMLGVTGGLLRRLPRAMHSRDFALFVVAALAMNVASQMIAVAIGWQVYEIHHRAFDLGLIGLLEVRPVFVLALPAGQLADRVSRT